MYIIGASGHAKVVYEILQAIGANIEGVIDADPEKTEFRGHKISRALPEGAEAIVAIGNCATRRRIAEDIKAYPAAIHPSATVSPSATVGDGTVVMQGAVIQADAVIGRHCIINTLAGIDHECRVGDYVHIAPGCAISGNVEIGEGSWIGVGTTIIQGAKIGKNCFICAGSLVTKDIPDNSKAFGAPCRVIGPNK